MTCDDVRPTLGAHVLDSLDADEAARVAAHVERCPACRAERDDLAGLPTMLALVEREHATMGPPLPGDALLARVLAAVAVERRRTRRRQLLAGAAAVAAAVAVSFLAFLAGSPGADDEARSGPSTTSPAVRTLSAADPVSGVRAAVAVSPTAWGSALDLELAGVPAGERCRLVVVGRSGATEVAASWEVPSSGYGDDGGAGGLRVSGSTAMAPEQIARLDVVTFSGRVLVRVPA